MFNGALRWEGPREMRGRRRRSGGRGGVLGKKRAEGMRVLRREEGGGDEMAGQGRGKLEKVPRRHRRAKKGPRGRNEVSWRAWLTQWL